MTNQNNVNSVERSGATEQRNDGWISVKDRLPPINTIVLVRDTSFISQDEHMVKYGNFREPGVRLGLLFESGDFRVEGCNGICKIDYWQPIPTTERISELPKTD